MYIPPRLLAKAEILSANFPRDSQGNPDDETLANTVTWLIDTFTLKRSLDLALAIGRKVGEHHCIRALKEDGSVIFAFASEEPHQAGREAEGNGITIFGRAKITEIAQGLSGEDDPQLQVGIAPSERRPSNEDATLIQLAGLLPWYRGALKLPARPINSRAIVETCLQLGMPNELLKR